jgi:hypothetical protein
MTCIAESRKASQSFQLPFGASFDWFVRVGGGIARAFAGRRVLRELASFDDRMLKDIGLTRADLRNAAAEPLYRDPTTLLAGRVGEFRPARRVPQARREPRAARVNVISY